VSLNVRRRADAITAAVAGGIDDAVRGLELATWRAVCRLRDEIEYDFDLLEHSGALGWPADVGPEAPAAGQPRRETDG